MDWDEVGFLLICVVYTIIMVTAPDVAAVIFWAFILFFDGEE